MPVDYDRPEFVGSFFKPPRGTRVLEKEKDDREETAEEIAIKKLVRLRDGKKCRCPWKHKCRGGLEVIHWKDKSTGGLFITANLWLGCKWIHRTGTKTIHSKDIVIVPRNKKLGMDGPVDWFLRVYEEGRKDVWKDTLIARESAPGVVEQ